MSLSSSPIATCVRTRHPVDCCRSYGPHSLTVLDHCRASSPVSPASCSLFDLLSSLFLVNAQLDGSFTHIFVSSRDLDCTSPAPPHPHILYLLIPLPPHRIPSLIVAVVVCGLRVVSSFPLFIDCLLPSAGVEGQCPE